MRVIKEKVVGTHGSWVIKARMVEYWTKQQGQFNRAELVFEKMGPDEVGFAEEDLAQFHAALVQFKRDNLY